MKTNNCKKKSLQRRLLFSILVILAISSFLAVILIFNILPFSSSLIAGISDESKINAMRVFRSYLFFSTAFVFILSSVFITYIINKTLKPVSDLTDGTYKIAQGDFNVAVPVDIKRNDELSILANSFNKMANELSFISMLNKDFINNVSHEFKTPISSIQGFATLLLGANLTDGQREYAEIIVYESARLTKLITNILKLTKLENQIIVTDKEDFYIDEQIRHSFVLLQNEMIEKNIEIDFDLSKIKYNGNSEFIQQIWHNLLGNAIKFSGEKGQIHINCYVKSNHAVVSIKDRGIGMNKSTITRIFEKFYQGDKSHSNQGNGLGLPLVKRIIELCNGTIDVNSELGQGSEFIVRLPL